MKKNLNSKLNKGFLILDFAISLTIAFSLLLLSTVVITNYKIKVEPKVNQLEKITNNNKSIILFSNHLKTQNMSLLYNNLSCGNLEAQDTLRPVFYKDDELIFNNLKEGFFKTNGLLSANTVTLSNTYMQNDGDVVVLMDSIGNCETSTILSVDSNSITIGPTNVVNSGFVSIYNLKEGYDVSKLKIEDNHLIELDEDGNSHYLIKDVQNLVYQYGVKLDSTSNILWLNEEDMVSHLLYKNTVAVRMAVYNSNVKSKCIANPRWSGGFLDSEGCVDYVYEYVIPIGL